MPPPNEVDAIIVGGGPCGLTLAKGLLDQGYSVVVIEKEPLDLKAHDWSKAYSFRVDVRGLRLLKTLGLHDKLIELGVKSEGFKGTNWMPDGSFVTRPPKTLGSVAYWAIRPKLLKLLSDAVPEQHKIQGEVTNIQFDDGSVSVSTAEGTTVRSKFLFGCDGIRSQVRSTLATTVDTDFTIHKIDCPSAGLVFRATLIQPPESLDPDETYMIVGRTGDALSMMPYGGEAGKLRPIAKASQSSLRLFQPKTAKDLFDVLDEEFPQLHVRERMSLESAQAWCETEGSTFPRPRWAGKACALHNGVFVCILGDALHSFPPDLGQGLNSGMVDVERVLEFMKGGREASPSSVASLNEELVSEAHALCQLLPIGMPYQYKQPLSLQKILFLTDFMTRWALHGLVSKTWFHAPSILEIQDDPPKKYTTILERHRQTSRRMLSLFGVVTVGIGSGWLWCRHR